MENSNNEKWHGWGHVVSNNEQKNVEALAAEKYPLPATDELQERDVDYEAVIYLRRNAFIAGHTAATEEWVKKDEVIDIFKWLLGYYDFPEPPTDGRAKYYWRTDLRAKLKDIGIEIENPCSPFQAPEKGNLHD